MSSQENMFGAQKRTPEEEAEKLQALSEQMLKEENEKIEKLNDKDTRGE